MRKKLIGSRAFYAAVLSLLIPMIVQQGITQFVNLLDNVMVGRLGTTPMSGVAIVNQIVFIFNLTIFGGLGGASIFGAQFFGKKDYEGVRYTLRFRLVFSMAIGVLGIFGVPAVRAPAVPAVLKRGCFHPRGDRLHPGPCPILHEHHLVGAAALCPGTVLFQHPAGRG